MDFQITLKADFLNILLLSAKTFLRLHRTLNEEQVVVLEIAECTKMKIQQNGHDFTVGQRRLTPLLSSSYSKIAKIAFSLQE